MNSTTQNVVRRFLADVIADPKAELEKFRGRVVDFCKHEEFAKAELPKLKAFVDELTRASAEPGGDEKFQKTRELSQGLDKGQSERYNIKWEMKGGYWFKMMRSTARMLFWAIIQQYALPPQLQKAIESGNKFWSKERTVLRIKSMTGSYDEDIEILAAYLKTVAELHKQLANAEAAIVKGKLHSDPEQAAKTKFPAGAFTVVNTGAFDDETMKKAVDIVLKAEKAMTSAGLGKCCYGDVLISKHIRNKKTIAAFYLPSSDEFFVRADMPDDADTDKTVCHELAHRLEHKFLSNKKAAMIALYNKLLREHEEHEAVPASAYPHIGEEYTTQGVWAQREPDKKVRVKDYNLRKKTVQYYVLDEFGRTGNAYYEIPIQSWWAMFKGQNLELEAKPVVLGKFVTHYAKVGGPFENFAEMVAYYVLKKLPEPQVKPLEEILFG
jgi:hypothetical protein